MARPLTPALSPRTAPGCHDSSASPVPLAPAAVLALPAATFLVVRALDLLAIALVGARRTGLTPARALHTLVLAADGGWYQRIAATGYPRTEATGGRGLAHHSALAFFPAYPALVGGLERLLRAGFVPVALGVSLLAGAVAAAGVAQLVRPWAAPGTAAAAGVLWAVQPASPVLGLPYTESLFSALVVAVVLVVVRGRPGWLLLLLPLAGLTRGTMPPLAAALVGHLALRGRQSLHEPGAAVARSRRLEVAAVISAVAAALAWPAAVAVRTGRWDAFTEVQSSWNGPLHPLAPFVRAVRSIAAGGGGPPLVPTLAVGCVAAVTGLTVAAQWLRRRSHPDLPVELVLLGAAFVAYLVVLVPPDSSYPRFFVPVVVAPIALAALLAGRSRWWWVLVGAGCAVGQVGWLAAYVLGYRHLTP